MSLNPTGFNELFNFNDSSSIEDAIKLIEKLNTVYDTLVIQAQKNSEKYSASLNLIAESAAKLEKQLIELDSAEKEQQAAILKTATDTEKLAKSQENASKSFKDEQAALAMLTDAQTKLKAAKESLNKQTILEAGSMGALKKQLKEAVALYESYGDATSQAVKDETLKKIKDLSKSVAEGDKALKDAKKGVDLAAGSYNSLAVRVADAKKKLKEMEGGIGSTSKEFKDLKKFAADGTKQLKEFDDAVGDNNRNVGNYKDALTALPGPLQGLVGGLQAGTKAALAFIATPIGLILGLIAAALGAVTAYFNTSAEGQENLNKVMAIGSAIFQTFLNVLKPIGKAIFDLFSNFNKLNGIVDTVSKAFEYAFDHPVELVKKLGDLILTNIVNRFKSVGVAVAGVVKLFKGEFKEGFKDLANAGIQATTGIENGVEKIQSAAQAVGDAISEAAKKAAIEAEKQIALALKIANLENKIRRDKIADVIDDSKTELSVTKLLVEAKDKLKFSDEQRFEALRKANKELEDQLVGDLQLTQEQIDLVDLEIASRGDLLELQEKRAQLEAEYNNQQTAFFNARKNRQKQEIALIQEIDKETQDRIKREKDAERALDNFITQGRIDANKDIIADERSTSEQRIEAIHGVADDTIKLAEDTRDAAIEAAKQEALSRINLDDDTLTKIYNNESVSINERIAQERKAKEALLGSDKAYVDTRIRITDQFLSAEEKAIEDSAKAVNDNLFKTLENDFKHLDDTVQGGASNQVDALNAAYLDGNITASQLAKQRQAIQDKAQIDSLNAQLDYLEKYKNNLKALGFDTASIEKEIANVRVAISQQSVDKQIENEKKLKDAVLNLAQTALSSANEIVANRTQVRVDALNTELQAESDKKDRSIAIAGDDAQAKAFIEEAFAQKQRQIQKQIAVEKRKQAVFEKATALTQAGINTALAITNALGSSIPPLSFILAALVGAAGAIQIAAIASRPIPQFFTGTKDSPEGLALIGDRGREIVKEPGKAAYLADRPQYKYLKRHSIVYNNPETESLISDARLFGDGFGMPVQVKDSFDGVKLARTQSVDVSRLASAINKSERGIVDAVKSIPKDHYDEYGYRRYERSEGMRIVRLDQQHKLQ